MTHAGINSCRGKRFCIIAQAASCQKASGKSIPVMFPATDRDADSLSDVPGAGCRRNKLPFPIPPVSRIYVT